MDLLKKMLGNNLLSGKKMRAFFSVALFASIILQVSIASAQYVPKEAEINGMMWNQCFFTERPELECIVPAESCRVYYFNLDTNTGPIEEIAFTVYDYANTQVHAFAFWDDEAGQWVDVTNGDPGINITRSQHESRIENTDPDDAYFRRGLETPVLRASRYNLNASDPLNLRIENFEAIEIWEPDRI